MSFISPPNFEHPSEGPDLLTIVLIHEDEVAGRRAEKAIARFVEGLDDQTIVRQRAWSFEELAVANEYHEAGPWLSDANIIFVASRRHREPPAAVGSWLRQGPRRDDHSTALVALGLVVPNDSSAPKTLFSSLELLCADLGLRFFSSSVPMPADAASAPRETHAQAN